jgi:hypothetical protein
MSRMIGFEAGRFEKPNRYLFAVVLLLVFLILHFSFEPFSYRPENVARDPLFVGYRSQVIRVEPLNLSVVEESARKDQFDVEIGDRYNDDEFFETNSFLGGGSFDLSFGVGTNSTQYNYVYLSNETGRLNRFWERFGYYFNLSSPRLAQVKSSTRYDEDSRGKHFGGEIEVKPVWSRVAEDAGEEINRDISRVGVLDVEYNTTARFWLRTRYLQISTTLEGDVKCVLMIDEDSDVELFIESDEKMEDPGACFTPIFEAVGIPESFRDAFKFEEEYAAYA